MIATWVVNLHETGSNSFQGGKKRSPVKSPPEPERRSPPIGPPKRDPKPEPIHDPPMPPSPGTDPKDKPLPIGDPPDTSDQPIRMTLKTAGFPIGWPVDTSRYKDMGSSIKTRDSPICDPLEPRERRSL